MDDVVYATSNDVTTLEPTQVSGFSDHTATLAIFGTLTFNFDGRTGEVGYYPYLAEVVEAIDEHTWRIKLREGYTFHNGEPLNAEAVKFSFDRIRHPEFPSGRYMKTAPIESVEVVDEYTVHIHTRNPIAILHARLLRADGYVVAPSHYADVPPWSLVANTAFDPIGAGPFKFVEHRPNDRLILKVNREFKDPRGYDAPNFDRLILRVIPEPSELITDIRQGGVDIAPIPAEMVPVLEEAPGVRVIAGPDTTRMSFEINQKAHPALADKRVRQAINYAIDANKLLVELTGGQGVRLPTLVNPPNVNPTLQPYPYDPERARELLAEAGYADGFTIDIDWSTAEDRGKFAESMAIYLREIGIDVREIRQLDWGSEYLLRQKEGTLAALHGHGHAGVEMTAETDLWPLHPEREANSTNWEGPEAERFSKLYRQLQATVDQTEQQNLSHQLQTIVFEEALNVTFGQLPRFVAVSDRIGHFIPYPGGHNEDFWTIRLRDERNA
jgi:peptide/nickel transport system substrate-binding protein